MADLQRALDYVEGSEFRKEAARRIARRIAAEIDVMALLDGGEEFTDDLLDALLGRLWTEFLDQATEDARQHAVMLGLAAVSPLLLRQAVEKALEPVLTEAITTLTTRMQELERGFERMVEAGTDLDTIRTSLASDGGREAVLAPVTAILAATGAGLIIATERSVLQEAVAETEVEARDAGEEPPLFRWVTMQDERVCESVFENSCAPRHGRELTYEEWVAFGEPGTENTICGMFARGAWSNCRCLLEPVEGSEALPDPVDISEAIKRGKDRAAMAFPEAA